MYTRFAESGRLGGWQVEKIVQEDGFVVFKVVRDRGATAVQLDLGLYFLVKKKVPEFCFFLITNFFFLFITCIIKYTLIKSYVSMTIYILTCQKSAFLSMHVCGICV